MKKNVAAAQSAAATAESQASDNNTTSGGAAPDAGTADGGTAPATDQPDSPDGTAATAEPIPVVVVDPFADLPRHELGDAKDLLDMTSLEVSLARKYDKVHTEAHAEKLPIMRNWKHAAAMLTPGTNKGGENGFKPGSVYGIISDIVRRAGRAGIPAYEVATELRKRSMGANKRSHYCEKLPPVGWAEGWLNSAITKGVAGVHATKKAPLLSKPPVAEKGTESTAEQDKAAIADQTGGAVQPAAEQAAAA